MLVNRTCQRCGAAFTVDHAVIKFGRGKHCSTACVHAARSRKVTCICRQCGIRFTRHASRVAHGRGRHCGRACAALSRLLTPTEGFWAKVDKDGPVPAHLPDLGPCWIWTGGRSGVTSYGSFTRGGRSYGAHRVSWEIEHGRPVPAGLVVCHRCDNPPCVRPDHLFAGTQAENIEDKIAKGRQEVGRGMAKSQAKLTDDDVREIRAMHEAEVPPWTIARHFGIAPPTVWAITRRKSWRHVV